MARLKVIRMGHPNLRVVGRKLTREEILSDEMKVFLEDMLETMHAENGIGLAATQVNQQIQCAMIEIDTEEERYPSGLARQELEIFFNPEITILDDQKQGFWEGCLSVPELRGLVWRPRKIKVEYLDQNANPKTLIAEDFLATVVQHELDHLQGVLFIDRVEFSPGKSPIAFTEEYQDFILPNLQDGIRELKD